MTDPNLPPHLKKLQIEIEQKANYAVIWRESEDIDGEMSATIQAGTPIVYYRNFTEAGAAEELMHLKLQFSGIPGLKCAHNLTLSNQVATILTNIFEHQLIYPLLEKWDYNPRKAECKGILVQLDDLEKVDKNRLHNEPDLQALFATIYARGILDCGLTDVISRLDTLFSVDQLQPARILGEKVIKCVQQHEGNDPENCRATLRKCLEVLKQDNIIEISD